MSDGEAKTAYELALEKLARNENDSAAVSDPASGAENVTTDKSAPLTARVASPSSGPDFEKISSNLKNMAEKNYISQLSPSITDTFLSYARYTNSDGIVFYKNKFDGADAATLADLVYDQVSYHTHRRYFGMTQEQVDSIKDVKTKLGDSYMDLQVKMQFNLDRQHLKSSLVTRAEQGETIDDKVLGSILEDNIQQHTRVIAESILKPIEPQHMDLLKAYISELGNRYKFDQAIVKRANGTYDLQSLIKQYFGVVMNYYHD